MAKTMSEAFSESPPNPVPPGVNYDRMRLLAGKANISNTEAGELAQLNAKAILSITDNMKLVSGRKRPEQSLGPDNRKVAEKDKERPERA